VSSSVRGARFRATPDFRVGIVGLGYWGPNLARVVAESDVADLAWLCDLDEDKLDRHAYRYPAAKTTADFRHLLADPKLDAVLIATPVFTHTDLVREALEAGKHVLVEKPLAASTDEADDLLRLAEDREQVLMCGHTFLYSPPVQTVKGLLDDGAIGDLHFISSSRVNLGLHQSDVSVVWDLGPHDFSILRYWLDEGPVSVSALGRDSIFPGIHDVAFVNLSFQSGIVANLEMSWLAPSKLRRTVLVGSKKMIVYEDGTAEPVRVFDHGVVVGEPETFGEYQLTYRTGDILSPHVDTAEPLALQVRDFVRAAGEGQAPDGHAQLCRDVVGIIESADRSLNEGGMVVETAPYEFQ
jgi:predicted dehydrogenase